MSRALKTTMTKRLLGELQALIAFACFDSPSMFHRGGDSMTEAMMSDVMTLVYFDEDKEGTIDRTFFAWAYRPHFCWRGIDHETTFDDKQLDWKTCIRDSLWKNTAKTVITNCKKMMDLVTKAGSPYCDGNFPSGTNFEDFIEWCLIAMQEQYEKDEREKAFGLIGLALDEEEYLISTTATPTTKECDAAKNINKNDNYARNKYPEGTYFKGGVGFLAWAIWWHIPLENNAQMQSLLFSDRKTDGQNVTARKSMRRLMMLPAVPPVDDKRGKKTDDEQNNKKRGGGLDTSNSDSALQITLAHRSRSSDEKEMQKLYNVNVRNLHEKIDSTRTEIQPILQKCAIFNNRKTPDFKVVEQVNMLEAEIPGEIRAKLDSIIKREQERQRELLDQRRLLQNCHSSPTAAILGRNASTAKNVDSNKENLIAEDDVVVFLEEDEVVLPAVNNVTPSANNARTRTTVVQVGLHAPAP